MPAKLSPVEFAEQVQAVHGDNVVLLSDYTDYRTHIQARCGTCGHEWAGSAEWLRRGGCPNCAKPSKPFTHEQHVAAIFERFGSALTVVGQYTRREAKIKYRCEAVGHEFERTPCSILGCDNPCPVCYAEQRRANSTASAIKRFRERLCWLSDKNYRLYRRQINPRNYVRSKRGWHLDHIYSVHDVYYNPKELKYPVTIEECAHPANLRIINCTLNHLKSHGSEITATELRRRIALFDRKYGCNW